MHHSRHHAVHIPAIHKVVISEFFHLGLWLHHIDHRWKGFHIRTSPDHGIQIVDFRLLRLEFFYTLCNIFRQFMPCSPERVVFFLLLSLLKHLVRVCHQDDIIQLPKVSIFLSFSAHINQTVLETSPVSAYDEYAAIFKCMYGTVSSPL